ncbi:MAG: molybdopterin cofactor-binding domain-containing protein [Pseudomonadota bacterium]
MSKPAATLPPVSRRNFLAGSLGTSLVMGFGALVPAGCAREEIAKEVANRTFSPNIWFEMGSDGATQINIIRAEMGQHVGTALARIVADELGVAWDKVSVKHVDSDPKWGFMVTGGSWSVFQSFTPLSQAGAAGRQILIDAGAALIGVDPANCVAANSIVTAGDQSISYEEIIAKGDIDRVLSEEEVAALPLLPAEQRQFIGKPVKALDIPAKSKGAAVYGLDVELPGMVYARPVIPPTRYGSSVKNVDDTAAKAIKGYQQYLVIEDPGQIVQGWVAVIADSFWSAKQAADAIDVEWEAGPTATVSEADILAKGVELANDKQSGGWLIDDGDVDTARTDAAQTLSASYTTASALHFTLEPQNAVAEFKDGHWHIYGGNQWQSLILPYIAKSLEVEETDITLHQQYLGGGFGRRLFGDQMIPTALVAKALGKPVKMMFTREDDSRFDCIRSPSVQQMDASFDADGQLTGIEHAAAAGWPTKGMAPAFLFDGVNGGKIDSFSISGADHWYTLPAHRVRAINNTLAQDTFLPGWLRAVGPGWTGFAVESFMDEVAAVTGEDPVEFRLARLDAAGKNAGKAPEAVGGATRLARVLKDAAKRADWGAELPDGRGQGVAVCAGQERTMPTWVACVADVSVDRDSGNVTVNKLTYSIDCGTAVDPGGALAQAEGAALWGVSLALHEGTEIENGEVKAKNLDAYTPLRMTDVPELDIEFVDAGEFPTGLGEPPLIVAAPAIANAIYAAVGARVRDLPIRPAAVKAAMS